MDEEPCTELSSAMFIGNLTNQQQLIMAGTDVNQITPKSTEPTALFQACCYDTLEDTVEIVRLLVEHGADVEITNRFGRPCLIEYATVNHDHQVINYLVNVGARVNRRCVFGNTALHICGKIKSLKLFLRRGAIMRHNESDQSVIISNIWYCRQKTAENLIQLANGDKLPTFDRRWHRKSYKYSLQLSMDEKVDAYKLLGTSYREHDYYNTMHHWLKAIKLCKNEDKPINLHVKLAPLCSYCASGNKENAERCTEEGDAWNAVKVDAREKATGIELMHCSNNRDCPKWMSHIFPSFHCPSCPPGQCIRLEVHESVSRVRRSRVFGNAYLEKWQQLTSELQSLYKSNEVMLGYHGKILLTKEKQTFSCRIDSPISETHLEYQRYSLFAKPTNNEIILKTSSYADTILGIQPTCFVKYQYRQIDMDPISFYLQRQWLISMCYTPPRTTYRCTYSVCTVCCHIIIRFGGVHHRQSPGFTFPMSNKGTDIVCRRCYQLRQDCKQLVTNWNQHSYRDVKERKQESAVNVCLHCGLVSEQHPGLQNLRLSIQETFSNVREFTSERELEEITQIRSAFIQQIILIDLRCKGHYCLDEFTKLAEDLILNKKILTPKKYWRYNLDLLKYLPSLPYEQHELRTKPNLTCFVKDISRSIVKDRGISIDPTLLLDYLELTINYIESELKTKFYRCEQPDETESSILICKKMLKLSLRLITDLLLYYLPELPYRKSSLSGRCLIDVVVKEYVHGHGIEDTFSSASQLLNKLDHNKKDVDTGNKQETLSQALIEKFISEVNRLVCLDARLNNHQSLFHILDKKCKPLTINLLLRLGVDPNRVNIYGQTVVDKLLSTSNNKKYQAFRMLAAQIQGGIHLDAYSRLENGEHLDKRFRDFCQEYNICPVRNGKLACLAATATRITGATARCVEGKTFFTEHFSNFFQLH